MVITTTTAATARMIKDILNACLNSGVSVGLTGSLMQQFLFQVGCLKSITPVKNI